MWPDATDSVQTLREVIEQKASDMPLVLTSGATALDIQKIRQSR